MEDVLAGEVLDGEADFHATAVRDVDDVAARDVGEGTLRGLDADRRIDRLPQAGGSAVVEGGPRQVGPREGVGELGGTDHARDLERAVVGRVAGVTRSRRQQDALHQHAVSHGEAGGPARGHRHRGSSPGNPRDRDARLGHLRDDEVALVDVKRMIRVVDGQGGVRERPFLDGVDLHLRHRAVAEDLAVDEELRGAALGDGERILPLDVGHGREQRVDRLAGERWWRGRDGGAGDLDGRDGEILVVRVRIGLPGPTVDEVVRAGRRGRGDGHRQAIARRQERGGGDVLHPGGVRRERERVGLHVLAVAVLDEQRGVPRVLQVVIRDR